MKELCLFLLPITTNQSERSFEWIQAASKHKERCKQISWARLELEVSYFKLLLQSDLYQGHGWSYKLCGLLDLGSFDSVRYLLETKSHRCYVVDSIYKKKKKTGKVQPLQSRWLPLQTVWRKFTAVMQKKRHCKVCSHDEKFGQLDSRQFNSHSV